MIGRIVLALPLLGSMSLAAAAAPGWPSNLPENANETHPQVQSFYRAQCNEWSQANGKSEAERQKYVDWCMGAIVEVYPVGFEADEPGGDGDEG